MLMKIAVIGTNIAVSSNMKNVLRHANDVVANTSRCLDTARHFNDFENSLFGPDFWCSYEGVRSWIESGDLFYASVLRHEEVSLENILSVASILVVDADSYNGIVNGRLRESELVPFSLSHSGAKPVFYYSSLAIAEPQHLRPLFRTLASDIAAYCSRKDISVESAFTIAVGNEGFTHAVKSGFVSSSGPRYLGKYDVMLLNRESARTHFWKELLGPTECGRQDDRLIA